MEQAFAVTGNVNLSSIPPGTKILFANVPAEGHFNPLTGLAVHLQDIGCDVRWYSAGQFERKIKKLQVPYYPFKKAPDWSGDRLEKIFPERKNHTGKLARLKHDMINAFILPATSYYADINEIYTSFPFDLLIADITFSAIPLVKEKMGIPVISIGVLPLVETSKDLAPNGLAMTPSTSFTGRLKQYVLRFLANKVLFREPTRVMQQLLRENGIDPGNNNVFDLIVKKSTLVLQSGTPGFEYKRSDLSKNIRFIGALLPYLPGHRSSWWCPRLGQYEKIILVTQGTVEKDIEKLLVPVLEAFKNTGYLVVATTGGSGTRELKKRFPQENLIIEDFIPFADIMPYASVYITNGGYGGVMSGINNHLPLVVAGVHEGKNEINARIGYFKLGVNLKTERPTATQLKQAVEKIFRDNSYRQNVINLNREMAQYNPHQLCARYIADILQYGESAVALPAFIQHQN